MTSKNSKWVYLTVNGISICTLCLGVFYTFLGHFPPLYYYSKNPPFPDSYLQTYSWQVIWWMDQSFPSDCILILHCSKVHLLGPKLDCHHFTVEEKDWKIRWKMNEDWVQIVKRRNGRWLDFGYSWEKIYVVGWGVHGGVLTRAPGRRREKKRPRGVRASGAASSFV